MTAEDGRSVAESRRTGLGESGSFAYCQFSTGREWGMSEGVKGVR